MVGLASVLRGRGRAAVGNGGGRVGGGGDARHHHLHADVFRISRGECLTCGANFCAAFISLSGRVLCDYCGCPPARHRRLEEEENESVLSYQSGQELSSEESEEEMKYSPIEEEEEEELETESEEAEEGAKKIERKRSG